MKNPPSSARQSSLPDQLKNWRTTDPKPCHEAEPLDDEEVMLLASAIKNNRALRIVNFAGQKFNEPAFTKLMEAIATVPGLVGVNFDEVEVARGIRAWEVFNEQARKKSLPTCF